MEKNRDVPDNNQSDLRHLQGSEIMIEISCGFQFGILIVSNILIVSDTKIKMCTDTLSQVHISLLERPFYIL